MALGISIILGISGTEFDRPYFNIIHYQFSEDGYDII